MKEKLKSARLWQIISGILLLMVIVSGGDSNAQELTELKANVESLQEENNNLQNSYEETLASFTELESTNQTLQSQLKEKDSEIVSLKQNVDTASTYEEQIKELEKQVESLKEENTTLQSKVTNLETAAASSSSTATATTSDSAKSSDSTANMDTPDNSSTGSGTIVYITNTGEKYHLGSCSYLRQSKIEIDKEDAIAQGYSACSRCHP
ncbi:MAG: hypothetical protein HFI12_09285 [Lachnospiraceae bacterium]|nr:hypothetical protein [Lachnospiraceae bacterium]